MEGKEKKNNIECKHKKDHKKSSQERGKRKHKENQLLFGETCLKRSEEIETKETRCVSKKRWTTLKNVVIAVF